MLIAVILPDYTLLIIIKKYCRFTNLHFTCFFIIQFSRYYFDNLFFQASLPCGSLRFDFCHSVLPVPARHWWAQHSSHSTPYWLILSYNRSAFIPRFVPVVGTSGLEPPTSRLSGVRSNHLSYAPMISSAYSFLSYSRGGDEEDRTPDPLRARQVLSQLSYTPVFQGIRFASSSVVKLLLSKYLQN